MSMSIDSKISGNYSGLESFRSKYPSGAAQPKPAQQTVETKPDEFVVDAANVSDETKSNAGEKEVVYVEKKQKRSIWSKFRGFWASIQKGIVNTVEYTKGMAKGVYYGSMAAVSVLAVDGAVGAFKMLRAAKAGDKAVSALKFFSKRGKIGAGVAAAGFVGYHLFKAYLNANEKNAVIDHRWQTGHDEDGQR